jgi:hypothetical protein
MASELEKDEDHRRFLNHLAASDQTVWRVARWLHTRGYSVSVPRSGQAPNRKAWEDFADQGDLYINQRIEVKKRGFCFTGRASWPYSDFIVCARHSFDRATPKPFAYIVVSNDLKCAAIAMVEDHKAWTVATTRDRRYVNVAQECYFCPMEFIRFVMLEDHAEELPIADERASPPANGR